MSVHVFIATTQGPVAIQRIAREDSDVQSVVCLNGGSTPASIASQYYDFVKKGTGLIARDFGHDAWRLDISKNIEQGDSWQLPVYLAHLIEESGRLGQDIAAGDTVIWATGAVQFDGLIRQVGSVAEKFARSQASVENWLAAGADVVMLLPWMNAADQPPGWDALDGVSIHPIQRLDALQSLHPIQEKRVPASRLGPRQRVVKSLAVGAVIVLAGLLLWGYWPQQHPGSKADTAVDELRNKDERKAPDTTGDDAAPDTKADPKADPWSNNVLPRLIVKIKPDTNSCGSSVLSARDVTLEAKNRFAGVDFNHLCELQFETAQTSWVVGVALDRRALIPLKPMSTQGATEPPATLWQIAIPKKRWYDRRYALIEFTEQPTDSELAKFRAELARFGLGGLLGAGALEELLVGFTGPWRVFRHRLRADLTSER